MATVTFDVPEGALSALRLSPTEFVKEMRHQGWVIESRLVSYAAASKRVNQHAVLQPPSNLPAREIQLTEYWVSK